MNTQEIILGMSDPLAQRFAFCHLVLQEPSWDSMLMAVNFEALGPMTAEEYVVVRDGWDSNTNKGPNHDG